MDINEFVFVMEAQCVFCEVWSQALCSKCRLKHIIERMMEGTGRQGRRRRHLLDDLKETSGYRKLKEKALV